MGKPTIEHQDQGGEVIVWTYPANGCRYTYTFEKEPFELQRKTKTVNPATSAETTKIVAPTITPAVQEYLENQGYNVNGVKNA